MRVLVTGSRDWPDPDAVRLELQDALIRAYDAEEILTVVHGACPTGADAHADEWAKDFKRRGYFVEVEDYPADWRPNGKFNRSAGYKRNAEMVKLGADLCLAFIHNESEGATHAKELAEKAGIQTETFRSSSMPQRRVENEITLEDVKLIFRNFAGEETPFNAAGKRNFSIRLEKDLGEELLELGWSVKVKPPREEGDDALYHLPVTVNYKKGTRPPRVFMITKSKNRRNVLDEDTIMLLDYAELDNVDVILRPYNWDVQGKQGVKAYLKTLYATLHEDELDEKYSHIPDEGEVLELENIIDAEAASDTGWMDEDDQPALPRGRS